MKVYLIIILSLFFPFELISQTELSPEEIYEKVNDAVVIVLSYDSDGELRNQGSGVIVSEDSYVLTNYHLMENANRIEIMHGDLIIEDVEIIGGDVEVDLLVLRIPAGKFSVITIPESRDIKIGQRIYTIGSPMGYENTISEGIISGYRKFNEQMSLIQITASISSGSSGGAVVNSKGELIGISTYTITGGQNLNFAIPIKDVMDIDIEPYAIVDVNSQEPITAKEKEEKIEYPEWNKPIYDPKATEYFIKGKELISKAYKRENRKLRISYLKQAVDHLDKAIKIDSSLVEAYYLIGSVSDSKFSLNEIDKAKKYYDKVENFIDNSRSNVCDTISNREILVDIAFFYRLQEDNIKNNSLKSIQLYNKALEQPLPKIIPSYPNIETYSIYLDISSTYHQLASYLIISEDNYLGYLKALRYFNLALEYYDKLSSKGDVYELGRKDILEDKKVAVELTSNLEWKAFTDYDFKSLIYREGKPLTANDILFLYHSKTLEKGNDGIIRVWIKEVNLKGSEENDYDYSKSLYEFDLKNNKFRVLQYTSYYDDKVMDDENYPNAEWQYVTPETIAENMVENLIIIAK